VEGTGAAPGPWRPKPLGDSDMLIAPKPPPAGGKMLLYGI
jgi:hypothetical protein